MASPARAWRWPGLLLLAPVAALWWLLSPGTVAALWAPDGAVSANTAAALVELRRWSCAGLAPLALLAGVALFELPWISAAARGAMRRGLARAGVAALATGAMLCVAEGVTRSFLNPRTGLAPIAAYRPSADPELVYELVPGARCERNGIAYRVNREGFRGSDWPAAGTCRLMVVGDSLVYGDETREDQLFWRTLESGMGAGRADSWVAALGVGGYGTFQERRLVELFAPRIKPEKIVVLFCLNDVDDPYRHLAVSRPLAFPDRARPGTAHPRAAGPDAASGARADAAAGDARWGAWDLVHHVLWRYSRFYERLCLAGRRITARSLPGPRSADRGAAGHDWEHCLVDLSDPASARSRWLARQLGELAALSRAHAIPLAVAVAPVRYQLPPESRLADGPRRTVAALCRDAGLPCLDLFDAFAREGGPELFVDVCHFSPRGHAVVAREIAAWLDQGTSWRRTERK